MTPDQIAYETKKLAEIKRRAQIDATAHKAGWPVANPYFNVAEATFWRAEFDEALNDKTGVQR